MHLATSSKTHPERQTTTDLARRYTEVRRTTETICAPLSPEDQMVQSMGDASPSKWHQAHTTWFFETFILSPSLKQYRSPDPRYRFFFNSYYKQVGGHPVRAQRGLWSRPSLAEVLAYRKHVDEHMLRLIEDANPHLSDLIEIGLNHEQQHQELILTDIKHALWSNPLRPAYRSPKEFRKLRAVSTEAHSNASLSADWVDYEGGLCSAGHDGPSFSFDNETPRHKVFLQPFRLASRLVTNREYISFIEDGGYTRPELWLSEGWDTVNAQGWREPLYWERQDGTWVIYTLNGIQGINPEEPVCHISYYEADAYARWAGARLATEFEWEVAAALVPANGNLLSSGRLHPAPASFGQPICQLFGDVWEWTASQYLPYPGFHAASGALGEYNGKFMCNQFVLRGGSCATPADHIRATYRNFFPPQARWQFSGVRLAHD